MSRISETDLLELILHPPEGDALPGVVRSVKEKRDFVKGLISTHTSALTRDRKRAEIAFNLDTNNVFNREQRRYSSLIAAWEKLIELHRARLPELHRIWVDFHQTMQEGVQQALKPELVREQGTEKFAKRAKECLDEIEWSQREWAEKVMGIMKEIDPAMSREWKDAVTVTQLGVLGRKRPGWLKPGKEQAAVPNIA